MNANELADYLDNNVEAMLFTEQPYLDQAATMLRQQHAEIEALKIDLKKYDQLAWEDLSNKTEPVAWMHKKSGLCGDTRLNNSNEFIPLYTEPQYRELSDEEIYELYAGPVTSDREMVEFAHAILKKANEK